MPRAVRLISHFPRYPCTKLAVPPASACDLRVNRPFSAETFFSQPNDSNRVGCAATRVTKATRIFALGHLATHIDAKVALLKERGFVHAEPLYAQVDDLATMQAKLAAAPGALLFVGGAMLHTHTKLMEELYAWIPTGAPTLAVDIVHMPDFAAVLGAERKPPFSSEEVARASVYAIEQIAVDE